LSEDHLLSGLGGDRLGEEGSSVPGVEVGQETVNSGFTPSSKPLAEVDKVSNRLKIVLVFTLKSWGVATVQDDVGEEFSMADFLYNRQC
jgi:hypothetical protein